MRSLRIRVSFCLLLLATPALAQSTLNSSTQTSQSNYVAPKDPQAVSVIGQAVAAGGGIPTLMDITDYTATGGVTYHQNSDVNGTVAIVGLGLSDFRQDAALSTGTSSLATIDGLTTVKNSDGTTRQLNFRHQNPLMISSVLIPCWQLAAALNDPFFGLSYKGITQVDGSPAIDIRIQLMPPGPPDPNGVIAEYFGADFFIDPATFQVRMVQDVVIEHLTRQIRYSSFIVVNGILVPFLVDEQIDGHPTQTIQLNQITFNSGLQESAFQL